jgi:hypothetical protein
VGKGARVEENESKEAEEHQQVTTEVRLHWVRVQGECRRRSMVVQRHGGGPVGDGGQSSGKLDRRETCNGQSVC